MIDIHNHMLPGIDDGAQDWDQALTMARMAVEDGIEGVVCTPHCISGLFPNDRSSVLQAVKTLREKLAAHEIPLDVYPGSELRLDFELLGKINSGKVLTLNDTGRYVLIELPTEVLPPNLEHFFWELQSRHITTVLAHPERNAALIHDPAQLNSWVEMGVLTQITASSLGGRFGTAIQQFAVSLIEHQMVHLIATDSHGTRRRTPRLSKGYGLAREIVGEDMAQEMVNGIPKRILEGETVVPPCPIPLTGRKSWFSPIKRFFQFGKSLSGPIPT